MDRGGSDTSGFSDLLPPHNLVAEVGVLGSILLDNDVLHDLIPVLSPEHFYRDSHQTIYRAIRDIYSQPKPVDSITLEEELRRRGDLDRIGGLEAIFQIRDATPHAVNARYYAQIVIEKSETRDLIAMANEVLRDGYANELTAGAMHTNALRRLIAIGDGTSTRSKSISEIAANALERYALRKTGQGKGLLSGLIDLDEMTSGFHNGELIVIAARPSMGKTAFVLQIMSHLAITSEHRIPIYFASLEMGSEPIADRLIVSLANLDAQKFRSPRDVTGNEEVQINHAAYQLAESSLVIEDEGARTIEQITATARRIKARNGLGLVVVDYLQLIAECATSRSREANRQEHVAKVSRAMKILARDLDVPVILLSQLNRGVELREDHRPRMADIRESGAVENDADLILMLYRPEYYNPNDQPGIAEVMIAKQRNGPTGTVYTTFRKCLGRFESTSMAVQQGTEF